MIGQNHTAKRFSACSAKKFSACSTPSTKIERATKLQGLLPCDTM